MILYDISQGVKIEFLMALWYFREEVSHLMQPIYTPEEIADKLKTTRRTVYRWIDNGDLKAFKAGKMWRITRVDLEEFLGRSIPWEDTK